MQGVIQSPSVPYNAMNDSVLFLEYILISVHICNHVGLHNPRHHKNENDASHVNTSFVVMAAQALYKYISPSPACSEKTSIHLLSN